MAETIEERTTGYEMIAGTLWPVVYKLERQEYSGKVEYVLVRRLCNGVAGGSNAYPNIGLAQAAWKRVVPPEMTREEWTRLTSANSGV